MKFIIMGLVFLLFVFHSATFAKFYDSSFFENNRNLADRCSIVEQEVHCNEYEYSQILLHISTHLDPFMEYLYSSSQDVIEAMVPEIEATTATLTRKLITSQDSQERFVLSYVRAVFQDFLAMRKSNALSIIIDRSDRFGNTKSIDQLRREFIKSLIPTQSIVFVQRPYLGDSVSVSTNPDNREHYIVEQPALLRDDLDRFLESEYSTDARTIVLTPEEYKEFGQLALFKNQQDLTHLGYKVVSHRARHNSDLEYRRFNIATSFEKIGNVRVINPGETVSFLKDSQFDMTDQTIYRTGKVIFLDEEVDGYGGGLCGGSTALYQGIVLNKGFDIRSRNHTKWYTSLYTAIINGEKITTPGLDSTIYYPNLDLQFTNISEKPIILVSNYYGAYGEIEEIFTLGEADLRGSVEFLGSQPRSYTIEQQDGEIRETVGGCYKRLINDNEVTRCYKEILR